MKASRTIGTAAVVVITLTVAVPLVTRLAHALIVPAVVAVGCYVVIRVTRYFTEQ